MADSIQAVSPVNATITIQPVLTAAPNENGANPNQNPLANLANGTTVEGFVVNRDANNNPILRTAIGDLQVASEIFLKTGSEVTIKVDTSVPSLAKILSVDGLTPQDYSAQNSRGLTTDTISTNTLQPLLNIRTAQPASANLPSGAPILQGIILQPQEAVAPLLTSALASAQSGPANVLAQLSQLSAGTPLRLALLDIKLPPLPVALSKVPESAALDSLLSPKVSLGQVQQIIRQTEGQPQIGGYKLTSEQPSVTAAHPQEVASSELLGGIEEEKPLQNAVKLQQQVATAKLASQSPELLVAKTALPQQSPQQSAVETSPRVQPPITEQHVTSPVPQSPRPPQLSQPQLNQPIQPNQLVANIIGHDADGANILHTPFASLKVYTPQPLPTGTTLFLQVNLSSAQQGIAGSSPVNPAVTITPLQSVAAQLTGELSSFSDVLSFLASNYPDIAREVQSKLPNLSNSLASNMVAYIAGIKSGDITDIIGKRAVKMLEISAPDILSRLRQSVGQMQTNLIESPLPHWSVIPLPIWLGAELQQLQMYISKEPPENQQHTDQQIRGQRFVLEVGLSHIGDMQFDGFVRDRSPAKSFDLMVRTAAALPDDVNQGIRGIFENAMAVTGMKGQVIFQHGRQHFVKPLAEAPSTIFEGGANTILA